MNHLIPAVAETTTWPINHQKRYQSTQVNVIAGTNFPLIFLSPIFFATCYCPSSSTYIYIYGFSLLIDSWIFNLQLRRDIYATSSMPNSLQTHIRNFLKKVKVNNLKKKTPKNSCVLHQISSYIAMDVSNQLKQVFNFFDINGDGKISQLELTNVLLTFGHDKSMATMEAQGILKEVDFNGDGFIDLDEFMTIMDASNPVFAVSKQDNGDDDDLRNAFMVFDSDKNGLISSKELQRVLMSLGCSNSKLGQCRKMIKGVDKDGDGFVDFEEFKSMMSIGIN